MFGNRRMAVLESGPGGAASLAEVGGKVAEGLIFRDPDCSR